MKLACVLAHPDDESLGTGGTLARYATEGIETCVITATRGERGRVGEERPGAAITGPIREAELRASAKELGVTDVRLLDYRNGELDQVDPLDAMGRIAGHLRDARPDVVVTFGPEGAYGHPDHIAISQLTTAAVHWAADATVLVPDPFETARAHRVSKLYYMAWSERKWAAYQAGLRRLTATVDGVERHVTAAPDWLITTVLDTRSVWPTVWRAVCCHRSQMSIYRNLEHLAENHQQGLWGTQEFYRVFSTVNGGRQRETDLFEGLRDR